MILRLRRLCFPRATAALGLATTLFGAHGCAAPTEPTPGAIVWFAFRSYPADTLRVAIADRGTVAAADAYLAGRSPASIPIGPIRRGAGADPRYPFHFVPDSVRLAEVTIELCDGRPMHTPAEVDAFLQGVTGSPTAESGLYCPWDAYPVRVERR